MYGSKPFGRSGSNHDNGRPRILAARFSGQADKIERAKESNGIKKGLFHIASQDKDFFLHFLERIGLRRFGHVAPALSQMPRSDIMAGFLYESQSKRLTLYKMTIIPAQCRAARALIGMSQAKLAIAASLSRSVIVDFEKGYRTPNRNNLAAIQRALESAGVEFTNGNTAGVRLRKVRTRTRK